MTITGSFILVLWLFIIPLCIGAIPAVFVDKKHAGPGFMWTTGYILMWAVFQVICVPIILSEKMGERKFPYVVAVFGCVSILLAMLGAFLWILANRRRSEGLHSRCNADKRSKKEYAGWVIFTLFVGIQLILSVTMRYADGDDAFYVAVSTLTEESNMLYKLMPYSMGATGLNTRHSLAPFPIWIAFLSRVSGIHTAIVAHTIVSTTLILLTYVLFYQIGKLLLADKKESIPVFMCFTALLVIFGNYSIYSVENFMIARSRQGKAALGNIIIPMVIYLFLLLLKKFEAKQKAEWMLWVLLAAAVTAACLCSTLGTFLMCLFLSVIGLCAGVVYRNWSIVWRTAACCVPALIFATLYFVFG